MPYPGGTVESPPPFTLYGDGHAVYVDYMFQTSEGTEIGLRHAQLSEDQVTDLITFALEDGGLTDARASYDDDMAATDQGNTVFEIHGGGVDKIVSVYALGGSSAGNPDEAARSKFELLARRLQNFGADIANGGGEDLGVYEPEAYLVTADAPFGPLPNPEAIGEWPWSDLQPSDFETQPDQARQLTPEEASELTENPLAAANDLFVAGPDGGVYLFRVRALLPDEVVHTL